MRRSVLLAVIALAATSAFSATLTVNRYNASCSDTTTTPYCTIEAAIDDANDGDIIEVHADTDVVNPPNGPYEEFLIIYDEDLTIRGIGTPGPVIDATADFPAFWIIPRLNWSIDPSTQTEIPKRRPVVSAPTVTLENLQLTDGRRNGTNGLWFDGDDAVILRKIADSSVVDSIGQTGFDPGNEWGTGANSTNRVSLVREVDDCSGDTTPTDAFNPADEYDGTALDEDTVSVTGLGSHDKSGCSSSEPIISQYVESYGWNLALEIYNPSASTIDLAGYRIEVYHSGATAPAQTLQLTGILEPEDTTDNNDVRVFSNDRQTFIGVGNNGMNGLEGGNTHPEAGAAVAVDSATVTLNNVRAYLNFGCEGGAFGVNFGTLTINDSLAENNTEGCPGGTAYNSYGTLNINDSEIRDNDSNRGGAVLTKFGTTTITRSTLESNTARTGGGVFNDNGTTTIIETTIDGNTADGTSFGCCTGTGGGGVANDNGTMTIDRSTISNNSAAFTEVEDGSRHGGGILHEHFGSLTVVNSTLSGNTDPVRGAQAHIIGRASFEHVTVYGADNAVSEIQVDLNPLDEDADNLPGNAPGPNDAPTTDFDAVFNPYPAAELFCVPSCYLGPGVLTFQNSVIYDPGATPNPCDGGGTFNSLGNNLVFPADAGCDATSSGDISADPMLGALGDNGGPTETHEPLTGSPLIDAAVLTEGIDQRGVFRPQGPDPDIGSVELFATPGFVQGVKTAEGDFVVGGTVTYTIVLTNFGTCVQMDNPGDEFVDMFPSQLDVTNATADSGTVTQNGNDVRWNGSIAVGASVTITVTATIEQGGEISNTGTVNYDSDCNGTNDATSSTGTTIGPGPTVINVPAVSAEIPLASPFALMLLACMIALGALIALRGRL